MVYISLPDNSVRSLSFYLAMEEYVARNINEYDCFFQWQVEPSVIFGRNQLIENEVNTDFCRENGIRMFRRKSGGGCVYADMNNIMFSYITSEESVGFTFNRYINTVIHLLRKLNVEATTSGRNDILIDGKKVSGNAFYHIPRRNIVHGTMLYDTNMHNMVGSITPSDEKLMSKGIKSIRQRITLLKDYIDLGINEFKEYVKTNLCDRELTLTDKDIEKIKEIEKEYLSDEFIYGNNPRYTITKRKRIEQTGDFELRMDIKNNVIKDIEILGDFLVAGDINKNIKDRLKNVKLDKESLEKALPEQLDDVIMNLKKNDFINLIIS
ncbi:lipoate--protein ligase [uncultured Prevotella sp.]|uniref:lipoate--protein ligase n=1 Tax=uncultured Prevotella sp. TaxID=159272 RepID=UPI00260BC41E|nr:lipoate--protein ligase [uncultured Prevotella sp.]